MSTSRQRHGTGDYAVAGLTVLLVFGVVASPAVATAGADTGASATAAAEPTPAVVVALAADGSADVTVRLTYDLQSDAERVAFRTLKNDATAREDLRTRFRDRMQRVARSAANATGREMAVTDARIELSTTADNTTGIVELTVTWDGFAAVRGDRLVVTEPFASGFETDRRVVLRAPDGYELASAAPAPDARTTASATWKAGTGLSGFEVVVAPADGTGTGTPTTEAEAGTQQTTTPAGGDGGGTGSPGIPGFTVVTGGLAVLVAGLLTRWRSQR